MDQTIKISDLSISIVEPSSTQWKIIENIFHQLGVTRIDRFESAKEALQDMRNYEPDVAISTMHLPDMTATQMIQQMRTDSELEHIPFILISSEHSDYYLEPIRQAGVVAILPKPFQINELKSALYSTLEFIEPDQSLNEEIEMSALHVLVVDDSITARKHIVRVLTNLGIETGNITQAVNGKEALQRLEAQFYDLIVTDYNMPEMDGKELTQYIRQNSEQRSIPILMVTSEASSSQLSGIKQQGVSAMCDKPFEPNEVKSLLRKILLT